MEEPVFEANFDSLVGPTHHYGGLSFGNLASMEHSHSISNPKQAALQGLNKMRELMRLGLKQGVLPPHERPYLPILHHLGYHGSDAELLKQVYREHPALLIACSSSSSMWAANAATVSPSADSRDGYVHFTPANLISKFHRSLESPATAALLKLIFFDPASFRHHDPLPAQDDFADEGAANHTRFCSSYGSPGIQLFVYGRQASAKHPISSRFPARQTFEASQTIARLHHINPEQVVFAQQNPEAIDAGVFHNDVVSVGNQNVFFYHQKAFMRTPDIIAKLACQMKNICDTPLQAIEVAETDISLKEAVQSYLFNSQLITLPDHSMMLIAPTECQQSEKVRFYLESLIREPQPIKAIHYMNVRESMQNGGGPACLRLRIVLTSKQWQNIHRSVILTEALYNRLADWIQTHYRDRLSVKDLADPDLLQESRTALDALTHILQLGSFYSFQKTRI